MIYFNWTFNLKIYFIHTEYGQAMIMYRKFYIKQMNLELEVVQPMYVQKITIFGMSDGC